MPLEPHVQNDQLDFLRTEASEVRRAIEATPPFARAGMLVDFPNECCHHAVNLLALHLSQFGLMGFARARGERTRPAKCHVWLKYQGIIIDITADQFGRRYRPVIVTRHSSWHEAWKPVDEPITEDLLSRWRASGHEVHRAYHSILCRSRGAGATVFLRDCEVKAKATV